MTAATRNGAAGATQAGPGPEVLTIGHGAHPWPRFLDLLREAGVAAVVDVRSIPASRHHPHFARTRLAAALDAAGIAYAWEGAALGGRPRDPGLWRDGQPDPAAIAAAPGFAPALERVLAAAGRQRLALMCAESEPLACHRCRLLAAPLIARGARVRHLLADGRLEEHEATLARDQPAAAGARKGRKAAGRSPSLPLFDPPER